jgi:hypothetical protein
VFCDEHFASWIKLCIWCGLLLVAGMLWTLSAFKWYRAIRQMQNTPDSETLCSKIQNHQNLQASKDMSNCYVMALVFSHSIQSINSTSIKS